MVEVVGQMWENQYKTYHLGMVYAILQASVFCPNGDAVLASVVLETLKDRWRWTFKKDEEESLVS